MAIQLFTLQIIFNTRAHRLGKAAMTARVNQFRRTHMSLSDPISAESPASQRVAFDSDAGRTTVSWRLFYLLDSFEVGGTETQAVELALRMAQRGHRVTLGVLKAQGSLVDCLRGSGVTVEVFHPRGGLDSPRGLLAVLRLSRYLRHRHFEVVHSHDLWSNLMGVAAARLAGVPVIVSSQRDLSHDAWYQGWRRAWMRRVQNWSSAVLVNSHAIRGKLVAQEGLNSAKIRVIHNGVDTARSRPDSDLRQKLFSGLDACKLVVLVGNMVSDVKGHSCLIAAAPAVLREFPDARFVLVGDGPLRSEFEKTVMKTGVIDKFLFLGYRSDVPEILACCDLAVLPSRAEGFPNAALEYLAAGLPTVASNVGGIPELIEDGVTGRLVPPEDAPALSAAILSLLREPEKARQMGSNGRALVARDFSFEVMRLAVEELYAELLRAARPAQR